MKIELTIDGLSSRLVAQFLGSPSHNNCFDLNVFYEAIIKLLKLLRENM